MVSSSVIAQGADATHPSLRWIELVLCSAQVIEIYAN